MKIENDLAILPSHNSFVPSLPGLKWILRLKWNRHLD